MSRILLADDSPHAQRMGERILREEGFEVVTVTDGDTVMIRLNDVDPDVVMADVFLPHKSGYEICRYVKNSPRHRHARVVLVAGLLETVDEAEIERVKADGVLKKPFEASAVLAAIRPLAEAAEADRIAFVERPASELPKTTDREETAKSGEAVSVPLAESEASAPDAVEKALAPNAVPPSDAATETPATESAAELEPRPAAESAKPSSIEELVIIEEPASEKAPVDSVAAPVPAAESEAALLAPVLMLCAPMPKTEETVPAPAVEPATLTLDSPEPADSKSASEAPAAKAEPPETNDQAPEQDAPPAIEAPPVTESSPVTTGVVATESVAVEKEQESEAAVAEPVRLEDTEPEAVALEATPAPASALPRGILDNGGLDQSGADALVRARPPGRALAPSVDSYTAQDTSALPASPFPVLQAVLEPAPAGLPEADPELVRAAVTVALDRAMPALIDEITERVLVALAVCEKRP
jgi:DNA-binding response OmpR family regulator